MIWYAQIPQLIEHPLTPPTTNKQINKLVDWSCFAVTLDNNNYYNFDNEVPQIQTSKRHHLNLPVVYTWTLLRKC